MNIKSGSLIVNPIPAENALDATLINQAITQALQEAKEQSIRGKEVTPFLLAKVSAITEGKSKESNIALILHNTRVAGEIAISLTFTDL